MSGPMRQISKLAACVVLGAAGLPCASAAASETVAPLPESNYAVRSACSAPAPGHAGCLALQLIPVTAEALRRTHPLGMLRRASALEPAAPTPSSGLFGLRPQDLHSAYALPDAAPGNWRPRA